MAYRAHNFDEFNGFGDCEPPVCYEQKMISNGFSPSNDLGDIDQRFDSAREHMLGVIEAVYYSGDKAMFEFNLEELAHYLGMKLPQGNPVILK